MKKMLAKILAFCCLLAVFSVPMGKLEAATLNKPTTTVGNLVVFVRFKDDTSDYFNTEDGGYKKYQRIYKLYEDASDIHSGADDSFRAYLKAVSFNQFDVSNYFPQIDSAGNLSVLTLANNKSYYEQASDADFEIIKEISNAAASGKLKIDSNKLLDTRDTGILDNLTIIVENNGDLERSDKIYPHKSSVDGSGYKIGGKDIYNYNLIDSFTIAEGGELQEQGVLIHEFLHTLGLGDMYDRMGRSADYLGTWDLMSGVGSRPAYLLAYNRQRMGWININEINKSGTYTLDKVNVANGNQAYIIKSPLSDSEFFVVEYRATLPSMAQDKSHVYGFDSKVYNPGLIIYRVNTGASSESNNNDDESIYEYMFRPNDTALNRADGSLLYAALQPADQKTSDDNPTSWGNADFSATYDQNTICYENGTNSGIVINDIKINNNQLSFNLNMPDYSKIDYWEQLGKKVDTTDASDGINAVTYNGKQVVAYEKMPETEGNNYLVFKTYNGNSWNNFTTNITNASMPKLFIYNNELYATYNKVSSGYNYVTLSKYNGSGWSQVAKMSTYSNYYDVIAGNGNIYVAVDYANDTSGGYDLYKLNGTSFTRLARKQVASGASGFIKPTLNINGGNVYLVGCDIFGNDKTTYLYKYENSELKTFTNLGGSKNRVRAITIGNTSYFVASDGTNITALYSFDGSFVRQIFVNAGLVNAELSSINSELYISGFKDEKAQVYKCKSSRLTQFGWDVSVSARDMVLNSDGKTLYPYVVDKSSGLSVYHKEDIVNEFKSFSINGVAGTIGASSVTVTLPYGTNLKALKPTFIVKSGVSVKVNGVDQVSGETANDFTSPLTYTLLANDGASKTYTVNVNLKAASSSKEITSFSLAGQNGVIFDNNIVVTVPYKTDVTHLKANFTASDNAQVKINGIVQASGVSVNDFTNPLTYTVVAQDGSTQNYTVRVKVTPGSSEKAITLYSLAGYVGVISGNTINVDVPFGTDLTKMSASFVLSANAQLKVNNTVQISGITTNDFTNGLTYTAIAQDGSTQNYTVKVNVSAASSSKEITSFSLAGQNGVISGNTISFKFVEGTDLTNLKAAFILSPYAQLKVNNTLQVSGVSVNDFTNGLTYTVVAQDDSTQNYTVKISYYTSDVTYQTHVQKVGWQGSRTNGEVSGTSGRSLRLEGIKLKVASKLSGSIEYRTHIQNIGWENGWKRDGALSGTTGKSYRLEAIQIRLTGDLAKQYDVYYCVHAQHFGWLGWAKNGASAGTATYSYRLEAIKVVLVKKGGKAPGSTDSPFIQRYLSYQIHVQQNGWLARKYDGAVAGVANSGKRIESMKMDLPANLIGGSIMYRSYIQKIGWERTWKQNGQLSGTTGKGLRIEAMQLKLSGAIANLYRVGYQVYVQGRGWQDYKYDGETAGIVGKGLRIEAIRIKLIPIYY